MAGSAVPVIQSDSPLVDAIVNGEAAGALGYPPPAGLQANRDLVAKVLNHCFWASLGHEEGRPIASGLTFAEPHDVRSMQFCLERPELLTLESLVRLGTVAGTSYRLAIHQHDGSPHIWGFLRGAEREALQSDDVGRDR